MHDSSAAPPGPLRVRIEPAGSVRDVAPVWTRLEEAIGRGALMCSWQWTRTWLDHFGEVVAHRFVVAERAGAPCGIALLTEGVGLRRGPLKLRSLFLGTAGEPRPDSIYLESNRLLVAPEDRAAFAGGLLHTLRSDRTWHELRLPGFVPEDAEPFLEAEPTFVVRRQVCRTVDLDAVRAAGGDVLAVLSSSTRQKIRRSLRGFGSVDADWAETPDQASAILDELMVKHQARWGRAGYFVGPRARAFHHALVAQLVGTGHAILVRVRTKSETIGCLYVLVDGDRALSYQSGLASFEDNRLKPGMTTEYLCMQKCVERGLREYDFLAIDTRYKREMSTAQRELVWARARSKHRIWPAVDAAVWARNKIGRRRARRG